MGIRLGVNIDHVATLRQARYRGREERGEPDLIAAARAAAAGGADQITVHLREDRRHIQDADVLRLRRLSIPLNLEMSVAEEIVRFARRVRPDEACLVPERRQELTTEGGLDVAGDPRRIREVVRRLRAAGIAVSLFIDPEIRQVRAAAAVGADFVELHTGRYADALAAPRRRRELDRLLSAGAEAIRLGLGLNAGHGLNYRNVRPVCRMPGIHTLNIGHSIVSRAVSVGMRRAVAEMKALLN